MDKKRAVEKNAILVKRGSPNQRIARLPHAVLLLGVLVVLVPGLVAPFDHDLVVDSDDPPGPRDAADRPLRRDRRLRRRNPLLARLQRVSV